MKSRVKKLTIYLVLIFFALFLFRLIYGYTKSFDLNPNHVTYFESITNNRKNYASKKYEVSSSNNQSNIQVDQKYEKIAQISTKTQKFEQEEKQTRKKIHTYKAIIQFEQKSGNKTNRQLQLLIGVPPENFDKLYHELIQVGTVQKKQITKNDKTNQYKELNAKKTSLEKIRSSLIELKSKGGKIEEYMNLENRILEIEQQLQNLGVSLGDFDDENEFCTIQFSLNEGKEVKISLYSRIKVALEWTLKYYFIAIAIACMMSFFSYMILLVIDKLKLVEKITRKN